MRRAYENGKTREEWLAGMTAKDYTRLKALSRTEPIGTDAILIQLARVAQAFAGGRLEDHLVLNTNMEQTSQQIYATLRGMNSGNNS